MGSSAEPPVSALVVDGPNDLADLQPGTDLGTTCALEICQAMVDDFADVTRDHQWIHVDADRARRESPFGGPVAHGFLILSLVPHFLPQLIEFRGFSLTVNYGLDRVRFPSPVLVGSLLRASAVVQSVEQVPGATQATIALSMSVPDATKPACVATNLIRNFV